MDKNMYPKCHKALSEWLLVQAKLHSQPGEIAAAIPMDGMAEMIMKTNALVLQQFLDSYSIQCGIWCIGEQQWRWRVNDVHPMEGSADSRADAEVKCLDEGMKRLESRIK
jgi:hypothetical protein